MTPQNGSAHVIVIVGLVVLLMSSLGFIFWQNFIHDEPVPTKIEATKIDDNLSTEDATNERVYTLQNAIDDIQKVVSSEGCGGVGATEDNFSFIKVSDDGKFTGKNAINENLTYAYLTYGCGSQGEVALLKKEGDSWALLSEDARVYPMCNIVRGQGMPSSIVDKCYETDNSIEPVNI